MLGYVGSHRVGKTTLAETYAEEAGVELIRVSVSQMIAETGYDSSLTYDFAVRQEIQEHVLQRMGELFAKHSGSMAVADRTPLDAMIYTVAMVGPYTCNESQSAWLKSYMDRCFDMTNRHFSTLLVIQPGVPLVECETSAKANPAYIEHLNSLALGFISDERVKVPHYFIPRHIVDLGQRVRVSRKAVQRSLAQSEYQKEGATLH